MKLRKFSLSDLDEIIEIEKASFPNREAWTKEYFKNLYRKYSEGFIVAEKNSEIIGYTVGQPKNESAEIISLAVDLKWRKKGVGTDLTNFLIDYFRERNLKEIFLHARSKNESGISFYQGLDFKILKTIKNYYRNGDDAFLMKREI